MTRRAPEPGRVHDHSALKYKFDISILKYKHFISKKKILKPKRQQKKPIPVCTDCHQDRYLDPYADFRDW